MSDPHESTEAIDGGSEGVRTAVNRAIGISGGRHE